MVFIVLGGGILIRGPCCLRLLHLCEQGLLFDEGLARTFLKHVAYILTKRAKILNKLSGFLCV